MGDGTETKRGRTSGRKDWHWREVRARQTELHVEGVRREWDIRHGRRRGQRKECGGGGICAHGRVRSRYKACSAGSALGSKLPRPTHAPTTATQPAKPPVASAANGAPPPPAQCAVLCAAARLERRFGADGRRLHAGAAQGHARDAVAANAGRAHLGRQSVIRASMLTAGCGQAAPRGTTLWTTASRSRA